LSVKHIMEVYGVHLKEHAQRSPNKPAHHRKLSTFLHIQKTSLSMIYKLFSPGLLKDKDFEYCNLCGDILFD